MPPAEACRFAEPNYWLLPEYYEHLLCLLKLTSVLRALWQSSNKQLAERPLQWF